MSADRPTSTPPEARATKIMAKAILDIIGLLVIGALSYTQGWDWQVSLPAIATVLGLMRVKPIADKGGPLAFVLAGAYALRDAS